MVGNALHDALLRKIGRLVTADEANCFNLFMRASAPVFTGSSYLSRKDGTVRRGRRRKQRGTYDEGGDGGAANHPDC